MSEEAEELRDRLIQICEERGWYELTQRLTFVPKEILEKLLFETKEQAEKILSDHGY